MALFVRDAEAFVPTEFTRGPWDPGALHGGPVAALTGRVAEEIVGDGMRLVRLALDLVRPVPLSPLVVDAEIVRPGRRVQVVGLTVRAGDEIVTRGSALFVRSAALELPAVAAPDEVVPWALPHEGDGSGGPAGEGVAFHSHAVEMRPVKGGFDLPGPAAVWMRLRVAVVDGETPSPAVRALSLADFGNGISRSLPFEEWLFINPDLTVTLARPPAGEWVLLDARSVLDPGGSGLAESALFDTAGRFGRAVQSLFVDRRPPAPAGG